MNDLVAELLRNNPVVAALAFVPMVFIWGMVWIYNIKRRVKSDKDSDITQSHQMSMVKNLMEQNKSASERIDHLQQLLNDCSILTGTLRGELRHKDAVLESLKRRIKYLEGRADIENAFKK